MTNNEVLAAVKNAVAEKKITPSAGENITLWLTAERYAQYVPQIAQLVEAEEWKQLDDAFWTIIPFGTGGRRGRMFPVGTNVINDVTIGESAQGLATYTLNFLKESGVTRRPTCAIAYDTRHRSREFAELCACIMVANGFKVWFLDGYRSTPEMSFMVRYKQCDCGIMVTASHNPPSDNAVKVYWASGVQVLPPHDAGIIHEVMNCKGIKTTTFEAGLANFDIEYCNNEVDAAFFDAVLKVSHPGSRDLSVLYSPLHGVGASCVLPVLAKDGFQNVELYGPHAEPSGDFPNVPNHISNPENVRVFDAIIDYAKQKGGVDLILATDPDSDRLGCAAPVTLEPGAEWKTLTGNQIGAILTDYLLGAMQRAGELTPDHYVVETLVTSRLVEKIAKSYGVRVIRDLLVGFKYIGGAINDNDPAKFVLGAEESYGFLVGSHARDKDAAVASLVLCELAAEAKAAGKTIHQKLADVFAKYGLHEERAFSVAMAGSDGMERMKSVMQMFRTAPPKELAGMRVATIEDYNTLTTTDTATGEVKPLAGPQGNMVFLQLAEAGNYVAVRPSGTEPKVKFYLFASLPPGVQADLTERLAAVEADLRKVL